MLKTVFLTLFFSSTIVAFTDQPNYSQQLSNNIPFSTVPNSLEANPVCLMEMENGTIINLTSICRKAPNSDNINNEAARRRANRARATQQLNIVCQSPDLNADMRQLCRDGFPNN